MPEVSPDRELARVPILTYHSLDRSGSVISVRPDQFRRHMQMLHARGWGVVALGDLIDAWEGRRSLPRRAVVLTFDDGFRNVGEVGGPLLAELGFRATVFAVADSLGKTNAWSAEPSRLPELPLMTTAELRALPVETFEVGAHGLTHTRLDWLPPAGLEAEVLGSRRRLEDATGRQVSVFAYPYGIASETVRKCVRAHYRAACSVELGLASREQDRHWLKRVDAYYMRNPILFRWLGTKVGDAYLGLRAAGRGLKRRIRPSVQR